MTPWTTNAAGRNWRSLAVFRQGSQTLTNLGKLLQELIYWGGGMAETLLKERQKYKTQHMKHLILKKGWWRGCQRASRAIELESNRGRQPLLRGICSYSFSATRKMRTNFKLPMSIKDHCRYKTDILCYSETKSNLPALYSTFGNSLAPLLKWKQKAFHTVT